MNLNRILSKNRLSVEIILLNIQYFNTLIIIIGPIKPVCEFNKPHHIRTFNGMHYWIDQTIQEPLVLVKPCNTTAKPMPTCWRGRIFNFAISVVEWMPSRNIFPNLNDDIEPVTFRITFCATSPDDPNTCQRYDLDIGWKQFFSYDGTAVPNFSWSLNIMGSPFITVDGWLTENDANYSPNNVGGTDWKTFKTVKFCDGSKFSVDSINRFDPSPEMADYLRSNNCGLCGYFNGELPETDEQFRTSTGMLFLADDLWNFAQALDFRML